MLGVGLTLGQNLTVWRSGNGAWNDAARWTAGLPNPYSGAEVRGLSHVTVPPGVAPPVITESVRDAYELVLASAGDTLPARDAVDQRVLREVSEGPGHIIRWVREAGQ